MVSIILSWFKDAAIKQVLFLIVILIGLLTLSANYPIEFERSSIEVKDLVQVTKSTHYIVHTTMTREGANVKLETNTYYKEIKNNDTDTN